MCRVLSIQTATETQINRDYSCLYEMHRFITFKSTCVNWFEREILSLHCHSGMLEKHSYTLVFLQLFVFDFPNGIFRWDTPKKPKKQWYTTPEFSNFFGPRALPSRQWEKVLAFYCSYFGFSSGLLTYFVWSYWLRAKGSLFFCRERPM